MNTILKPLEAHKSLFVALLAGVFLSGCQLGTSDPTDPSPGFPPYAWGFFNVSDGDLTAVNLYMARHGGEVLVGFAGTLPPVRPLADGGAITYTAATPQRIPDNVTIKWKTTDGTDHRQDVSLKGCVPDMQSFHGTLWMKFDGDQWHPIPLTKEEGLWRATDGKGVAPVDR